MHLLVNPNDFPDDFTRTPKGARMRMDAIDAARQWCREYGEAVKWDKAASNLNEQAKAVLGWSGWKVFRAFAQEAPEYQAAYDKAVAEVKANEADYADGPLSDVEMCSYDNFFFLHPEKRPPGSELLLSGYTFPIRVKASTEQTIEMVMRTINGGSEAPAKAKKPKAQAKLKLAKAKLKLAKSKALALQLQSQHKS